MSVRFLLASVISVDTAARSCFPSRALTNSVSVFSISLSLRSTLSLGRGARPDVEETDT